MDNSSHRFINPDTIAKPTGYTHVVEARGSHLVFISGQVAFDAQGSLVGPGDMRAQAEQVFENLKAALAAVGAGFDDVVKVTFFIVDMSQMPVVREVRNRYLNPQRPPASTAVEVKGLVRPELMLEVEALAVLAD